MKKSLIIITLCCFILIIIFAPIIINESYKVNNGYITLWGAPEMLSYSSAVISAIGTIFIGIIAIIQNDRANKTNDRLLKLEEIRSTPFLQFDPISSVIESFREHEIDITFGFTNNSDGIINLVSASSLYAESFLSGKKVEVPFAKDWTKHYSVLPHQTRQFNFFNESRKEEPCLVDLSETILTQGFICLTVELSMRIKFVNSIEEYLQNYEFNLNVHFNQSNENKKQICHFEFRNIENSISKI